MSTIPVDNSAGKFLGFPFFRWFLAILPLCLKNRQFGKQLIQSHIIFEAPQHIETKGLLVTLL
jgi:hypothetical protein